MLDKLSSIEEQIRRMEPIAAPPEERPEINKMFSFLDAILPSQVQKAACTLVGPSGEALAIPESVFYVLERVVEVMARGDSITVVPIGEKLTTQQAANLLNISRQYLIRLLDENQLPFTKTGKHRRLKLEDVLEFKERRDLDRTSKLNELTQITENLCGYEELD
jgi:excisionase family DNA binding protein